MTQYGFYFDSTRCTGCRTCEMACKDYNDLSQIIAFRKIYDYEGGETTADKNGVVTSSTFMYHVSAACNHCADPWCAMTRRPALAAAPAPTPAPTRFRLWTKRLPCP